MSGRDNSAAWIVRCLEQTDRRAYTRGGAFGTCV